ncbi:hypothetical protein BKA70DRAFT_467161 [Coprinopsis sp. MPI-PUGE-AT-0042]|nr:hypothetical protein BKA70DRAFT_467161 [Coprinopsis sp. MPI-PUGE-AT-0042]
MGEVAKNLKRRRMKRTTSGRAFERDDGYVDDGSLSSTDCESSSSTFSETVQKRRRAYEVPGGVDEDQRRRHQDDQQQQQQHNQSRKTLLSPSTTSSRNMATTAKASTSALASNDAASQNGELADAAKYFTRSKIMDTTSLARTRFSDKYTSTASRVKPPPTPEVTYGDWEDLKEVWARCLEVIDTEEPEEILPLLRAIIHECGRFLEAFDDPSVLILAPPPPPGQTSSKVDSGVGTNSTTPPVLTLPPARSHRPAVPPPFVHPKDLPTAFHTLLGTALFFFGNIIGEAPHLALEGEPTSKVFYHLYAVDVFEMGENLPARTGVGLHREASSGGLGSNWGAQPPHCQDDCCTPGSKEDWRMSATWGRALVSLADELLEREQICDQWLAENPQPSPTTEEHADGYFNFGRPTYFGRGGSPPSAPFRPNPASFLSEDFISSGGVVREGYFGGTGGMGMGLRVNGMGGLTVSHPGGAASGYCSTHEGLQLPSSLYPLSSFNLGQMDGNKTPVSPQRRVPADRDPASPRVLSPFGTLAIGEPSGSPSNTPRSLTFTNGSGSRSSAELASTPNLSPSVSLEDPRRHWQKDSPFVVIWNRMPPVTRRMVLGGTHVNGTNPLPSPALPTPPEPSTFTLSWWNTDDSLLQPESNGRYPSDMAWDDDAGGIKSPAKKPQVKKNPGASVDEMMGLAVDHLSRGLFHMPRTSQPRGLGGVGSVDLTNGRPGKSNTKGTDPRVHHHHHRHHHRHSHRDEGEGIAVSAVQPFSRASRLLTIAMEVLMLAEKLPSAQSRYRWASHADSIFEQMRLEESPGIIKPRRKDEGMDVDIDLATGHISSDPDVKSRTSQRKAFSRTRQENPLDAPLYSYSQSAIQTGAGFLDSNRNEAILKARGRCSLIVGSAIAEDKLETYLEELDEEQVSAAGASTPTPESARKRRQEVVKLLKGEDAEEARAKLRESVDFLERARAVWREGASVRRKERERTKQRIERDRRARREASGAVQDRTRFKSPSSVLSPAPRRRGIGALAAENKKKRKERKAVKDAGMVAEDDAVSLDVDVDVEMGDVAVASSPMSPPASIQSFEEEDSQALELFAAEEQEDEQEEIEYARLIAEALVTLANILLVAEEGDEELGLSGSNDYDEIGSEKEREELYAKAKEEMQRAGVEEIDSMI